MSCKVCINLNFHLDQRNQNCQEIDKYLIDDFKDENDKFDILKWWNVNSYTYPILTKVANDVLAISISTVTLEVVVFNTDGRVLDAFSMFFYLVK